jgi:hypothetical protein
VSGSGSHTAKEAAESTLAQSTLAFPPTDFGVFSDRFSSAAVESVATTCNTEAAEAFRFGLLCAAPGNVAGRASRASVSNYRGVGRVGCVSKVYLNK